MAPAANASTTTQNGNPIVPPPGIWCPAVTFFDHSTDTLDLTSQKTYYSYLAQSGLTGLVILGTNAEAFLLTREERRTLIKLARDAVGPSYPLMAGCGSHSTKQTLELLHDAAEAGADYALVLPPAYFGKATTTAVILNFFEELAQKSPLPIVLYNFPGVCNGVDMDSETMATLAKRHPGKIVGVKLTCASVGKITRLSALFSPDEFAVYGGQADFLIGGLSVGSAGCIAAFANVFPKSCVQVYKLWKMGKVDEAMALHRKAALAESACKAGIAATKYAVSCFSAKEAGIKDAEKKLAPRAPYEPPSEAAKKMVRETMGLLAEVERTF